MCNLHPLLVQRKPQEVLEQQSSVARFVRMLPTSGIAVPIFKRFFQMKLDRVNHLMAGSLDHHLIAAKIRSSKKRETLRHAIELQSVILPDAQDTAFARVILPDSGFRIVDAGKDWIFRLDDTHEAILIFSHTIRAALFLLLLIERYHPRAKAQSDQLVTAANTEHRNPGGMNEIGEAGKQFRFVVIEVSQRPAQHNGIRREVTSHLFDFTYVSNLRNRFLHKALDVGDDILQRQRSDLSFALELSMDVSAQFLPRYVGEIIFVAQQIVDDQDTRFFDRFIDRFVTTEILLIERKGKRLDFRGVRFARICLLDFHDFRRIFDPVAIASGPVTSFASYSA